MKRNRFIDILKGLCIIFIILDHYSNWGNLREILLFPYWITMAVPILMIISGYVYAISYQRHNITSISMAYKPRFVFSHWIRFLVPFFIAYFLELCISALANSFSSVIGKWLHDLLLGGWGPGAYYTPIMLQFVLIFPLIYFTIQKFDLKGLLLCGAFNIVFEVFQWAIQMNGTCYKTLLFRYTLLIAFGCYLVIGKVHIPNFMYIIMCIVGGAYIFAYSYAGYEPVLLCKWTGTNFIAVLFIIPIIAWLLNNKKIKEVHCQPLELVGKASYNIYLVQMVYFNYVAPKVYPHFDIVPIINILNVLLCCFLGILFYYFTQNSTSHLK